MPTVVKYERDAGVAAKWSVWPASILLSATLIALVVLVATGRHENRYFSGIVGLSAIIIYLAWSIFTSPNRLRYDDEFVYLHRPGRTVVISKSDIVAVEAMFTLVAIYYEQDGCLRFNTAVAHQWRILSPESLDEIGTSARYRAVNYLGWRSARMAKLLADYRMGEKC